MTSAQSKGMAVEVTELIERLLEGVTALGLHEDNCVELFVVTDADEVMHEAAEALTTAQAEIAALREALTRQSDNMAFVLNNFGVSDHWYNRFRNELTLDRAALTVTEKAGK